MKKEEKYIRRYFRQCWNTGRRGLIVAAAAMVLQSYLSVKLPGYLQSIVDQGIMERSIRLIVRFSVPYMVLMVISQAVSLGLNHFYSIVKLKVSSDMKLSLLNRLTRSDGKSVTEQNSGDIIRILDNDLYQLESFGLDLVFELLLNVVISMAAFVIMFRIHPILLLVTLLVQVILYLLQFLFSKSITANIKKVRNTAGEQSVLQEELVTNLKCIILTNVTNYFLNLYRQGQENLVKQSNWVNFLIYVHSGISGMFSAFGMILTYFVGGVFIVQGEMSIGELVAFSQYCILLVAPFRSLVSNNIKFRQSAVALEHIYGEMERIQETDDSENRQQCEETICSLAFRDVSFSYGEKRILNDFNYTFQRGQLTVITGHSGSGKSTLLNLLYRLWEPDKGVIAINDTPITQYKLDSLKKKISIVCQESPVFNQGIKENVCLNEEKIEKDRLERAYQIVDMEQLLENGRQMDTALGESGNRLSGGQKQRIALARSLVQDSDVLILDECTSALDNISQQAIMERMRNLWKEKIVIIIAHRLSIARFADHVLVMDRGRIKEEGTYQDLMEKKGAFYFLAESEKA